jgi:DNA-directed RNA polymerase subunit RPC12/RpoP
MIVRTIALLILLLVVVPIFYIYVYRNIGLHRDYTCVNCGKDFSIKDDSQLPLNVAEGTLSVRCPYCQAAKSIKWPLGHRVIVVPKI